MCVQSGMHLGNALKAVGIIKVRGAIVGRLGGIPSFFLNEAHQYLF